MWLRWRNKYRPGSRSTSILTALVVSGTLATSTWAQEPPAGQPSRKVSVSISQSFLQLPETEIIFVEDDTGANEITLYKIENHDGELDGARIDAALDDLARWKALSFGVKGFYSELDSTQGSFCDDPATNDVDCGWMLLFDPDLNNDDKIQARNTTIRTQREARHWGVAAEAKRLRAGAVTLKSGVALKAIDQELRLKAADDRTIPFTLDYREELDTNYWGAYLGFEAEQRLFSNVTLRVDGEAGLYYARTEYDGRYNSNIGTTQTQSLSLGRNDAAVVASLKVEAEKDFGRVKLSVFGQGEWYSYAPEMAYNDTDRAPGLSQGLVDGTRIGDSYAYALTAGARATMLFGPGAPLPASGVAGWFSDAPSGSEMSRFVSVSIGQSFLQLPETEFILFIDDIPGGAETTLFKFENHDGELDGARIDIAVAELARWRGRALGVKGFYSELDSTQGSFCRDAASGDADCGWMFLFDPDPNANNKNQTDNTTTVTKREARHWGVAAEAKRTRPGAVTLKSGLALRAIDQKLNLQASDDDTPPETLDYREDLDTRYWGAYLGFLVEQKLFTNTTLRVDGEAGLYYARTEYDGRFTQNVGVGPQSQSLSLSRNDAAVVASLKVEAERDFGGFRLSVFGQGEWYSFAPEMAYNDTDRRPGLSPGLVDGTRIKESNAYSLTAGARVTVPLGRIPQ